MPMGHTHHHMAGMDTRGMEGMDMHDADAATDMHGMEGMDMHGMDMRGMHMGAPATDTTDGGMGPMPGMDHAH